MKQIVLTGAPCAGKTTVANMLAKDGIIIVPEAETAIVKRLTEKYGPEKTGAWILGNYFKFKSMVARRQEKLEKNISGDVVVYDRTAIDWIAYCKLRGSPVPPLLKELADRYKFEKVLFFEMLTNFDERRDEGRVMTKDEAVKLRDLIEKEYRSRGYDIIFISDESVGQRISSIRKHLLFES